MKEQTFVIIKPDGMPHREEILDIFAKADLEIEDLKEVLLNEDIIAKHYAHVIDRPFYPTLKNYMTSAPVNIMILSGEDAVSRVRTIIGCTDSKEAKEGTIRNLYGTDKTYNAVHASDSVENAKIEIDRFFNSDLVNTKTNAKTLKMKLD